MSLMKGKIEALCISEARGTVKHAVPEVRLIKDYGIEGDAHAGHWHRQVSLLSSEQVKAFNKRIAESNTRIQEQANALVSDKKNLTNGAERASVTSLAFSPLSLDIWISSGIFLF